MDRLIDDRQDVNTANAASIIAGLGGNPHTGMCKCPAHDDKTASLHVDLVKVTAKGDPVFYCHAGCTQEAVIGALQSRGLWHKPREHTGPRPRAIAVEHEDGSVEYEETSSDRAEKLRQAYTIMSIDYRHDFWSRRKKGELSGSKYEPLPPTDYLEGRGIDLVPPAAKLIPAEAMRHLKFLDAGRANFPAMVLPFVRRGDDGRLRFVGAQITSLDSDAKTKLNKKNGARRTYGHVTGGYIPLSPMKNNYAKLLIGEGVESVLSAMQITGLPGIACGGTSGVKNVEPPRAKEYIFVADHDPSAAGMKAAKEAAERLASRATVRIAMPEREGEDWNDVLRRIGPDDVDECREAILETGAIKPTGEIRVKTMAEFIDTACPPIEYLLKPIIEMASTNMIHAWRGSGKTYFALSIGYGIATGEGLLDWEATRPVRVLYVDGEMPTSKLQKRLRLLGPPSENLSVLSRDDLKREHRLGMPDLGTPEGRKFLDQIIEAGRFDVVIIDSVSTLVRSGIENEAEAWAPIQDWMMDHRFHERTFILLHHEGRSGHARGTSKREDVLDTVMRLQKKSEHVQGQESAFELSFPKDREFFGSDSEPRLLHLSTQSGVVVWSHQSVKANTRERVASMHADGVKQADIAKEVGLTKGRVSQIVKELETEKKA